MIHKIVKQRCNLLFLSLVREIKHPITANFTFSELTKRSFPLKTTTRRRRQYGGRISQLPRIRARTVFI